MIRAITAFAAAVALATHAPSPGPSPSPRSAPSLSPLPGLTGGTSLTVGVWTIHTTAADMNFKSGEFDTPSKVTMVREGGDISADRSDGNYKKQTATLYGHVVMHDMNGNFGGLSSGQQAVGKSRGPSTLTADQVHIQGKVYTATGNVHYVQSDTVVDADNGQLDDSTHDLSLTGNVHITQGQRSMQSDHVLYNTITGDAHAEGGVTMQFPSAVRTFVATPRPIHLKNPIQKKAATPAPTATASPSS